jgi:hypothetical protein
MDAVAPQVAVFLRQVRRHFHEHRQAMSLLAGARLEGPAIIRQELDSIILDF